MIVKVCYVFLISYLLSVLYTIFKTYPVKFILGKKYKVYTHTEKERYYIGKTSTILHEPNLHVDFIIFNDSVKDSYLIMNSNEVYGMLRTKMDNYCIVLVSNSMVRTIYCIESNNNNSDLDDLIVTTFRKVLGITIILLVVATYGI